MYSERNQNSIITDDCTLMGSNGVGWGRKGAGGRSNPTNRLYLTLIGTVVLMCKILPSGLLQFTEASFIFILWFLLLLSVFFYFLT